MERYVVAKTSEVPPGAKKLVEVKGRSVVLINANGEYFALLNRCPHQGGSLFHGDLIGVVESPEPGKYCYSRRGEMLRCAWHGWEFDVRNGQSWCDPRRTRVRTYPTSVEEGGELEKGPYVAESFPVTVEDEYVLIEA
jgi:3-phenylpropionate/trans-cinnamate dioxygenase ferredoxin subunit